MLETGWTSCDNKISARAGAESYMTRSRHNTKVAHQIKAACPSLYLAMCLFLVVLSQMSFFSGLTDTQQHQQARAAELLELGVEVWFALWPLMTSAENVTFQQVSFI